MNDTTLGTVLQTKMFKRKKKVREKEIIYLRSRHGRLQRGVWEGNLILTWRMKLLYLSLSFY